MSTPLRRAAERRSIPILTYLRSLPGWLVFTITLGLVLTGLFGPAPVGVAVLILISALIAWITYLAWPALTPGGRLGRLGALALVLAAAAQRVVSG
jgi:hypothetical protein